MCNGVPVRESVRALPDCAASSAALSDFRFRGILADAVFPFAVAAIALDAGDLRPFAGFDPRLASIHFDIAAELVLALPGTATPLSRAIASANDICAELGGLDSAAPAGSPSVSRAACSGACRSRNSRQIAPDFA